MNAVKWQAGIRREVAPLKGELKQRTEVTPEHSQMTRAASPDAVLQAAPTPTNLFLQLCTVAVVPPVETRDGQKNAPCMIHQLKLMILMSLQFLSKLWNHHS